VLDVCVVERVVGGADEFAVPGAKAGEILRSAQDDGREGRL